ncbi:MAG TPA: hypothetical protein VL688_00770 [Verrucomicrobiae bacterium]|jgi:hypothetical protein|nr:hypothetical protein [Verrucomicrobiae bacterium]
MKLFTDQRNAWLKGMFFVAALTLAAGMSTGCATHRSTYHESTTVPAVASTTTAPAAQTTVVETHEVDDHDDWGIFGGVFHVVGEVLAFPFDLIANTFRFIF